VDNKFLRFVIITLVCAGVSARATPLAPPPEAGRAGADGGSRVSQTDALLSLVPDSLYLQPGELLSVRLDVSQLPRPVNGCQAIIGFDSGAAILLGVVEGGSPWDDMIYWSQPSAGRLDLAVGVGLDYPGPASTSDDGTIATMMFLISPSAPDGTATVWFRADVSDVESTMLADTTASPLFPAKADTPPFTIDATPPAIVILSVMQDGLDLLQPGAAAVQRPIEILVAASDATAGLAGPPVLEISFPDGGTSGPIPGTPNGDGTFTYHYEIDPAAPNGQATLTASVADLCRNTSTDSVTFTISTAVLTLNALDRLVHPGQEFSVLLEVSRLGRAVNGCQAIIGHGSVLSVSDVAAGGPPWNDLIHWATPGAGKLDLAVGLGLAQGEPTSTIDDGTVALITVRVDPAASDGTTTLWFRQDVSDVESTLLADTAARPIVPLKLNSQTITIDATRPLVEVASAMQGTTELIGTGAVALRGAVQITVAASDAFSGLAGIPEVTLTFSDGSVSGPLAGHDNGDGTYTYTFEVTSTTPNGTAAITATATDMAGNSATATAEIVINKNELAVTVELDSLAPGPSGLRRAVKFVATGGTKRTWLIEFDFPQGTRTAATVLTEVPDGTTGLSAKTEWNLRRKLPVDLGTDGEDTIDFTGPAKLLGGDIDGSNDTAIPDYTLLKQNWFTYSPEGDAADINGDGQVSIPDYNILRTNWFKTGDPE